MDPVPSGRFDAEIATIKRYYNSPLIYSIAEIFIIKYFHKKFKNIKIKQTFIFISMKKIIKFLFKKWELVVHLHLKMNQK